MNPKQFLTFGGAVLVLVGVLGMVNVIGPTAEKSIFGETWWFDTGENWAHLLFGLVGLIAAFAFPAAIQRGVVGLVGVLALLAAIFNLFSVEFLGSNLERPLDLILHLVVAVWAFMSMRPAGGMAKTPPPAAPATPGMPGTPGM